MRIDRSADMLVELRGVDAGETIGYKDSIYMVMDPDTVDNDRDEDFLPICCMDDGCCEDVSITEMVVVYPHAVLSLDGDKGKKK